MKCTRCSPFGIADVGDIVDLPADEAQRIIDAGSAIAVAANDLRKSKIVEAAVVPPLETAMKPGPQARRSQHALS